MSDIKLEAKEVWGLHGRQLSNLKDFKKNIDPDDFKITLRELPILNNNFYLSNEFKHFIGEQNVNNVFGIDDSKNLYAIYCAFVHYYAEQQLGADYEYIPGGIYYSVSTTVYNTLEFLGYPPPKKFLNFKTIVIDTIKQSGNHFDNIKENYLDILSLCLNDSKSNVINTVTNFLNINVKNFYKFIKDDDRRQFINNQHDPYTNIPDKCCSPFLSNDFEIIFEHIEYIFDYRDNIISGISLYSYMNNHFCLPVCLCDNELSIGKIAPQAYLLNRNLINKYVSAKIILIQDMRVALAINEMLRHNNNYNPNDFIITSHLGSDIDVVETNLFLTRDVIFVPAPNFYSLAMAEKYNTAINKSGLSSFSISQIFILIYHSSTSNSSENNFSSVEDYILEKSIYINQECNIIDIINRAINESETLDKFTKRYTEFGIFKCKDKTSKHDKFGIKESSFCSLDFDIVDTIPDNKLKLLNFFSSDNITLIYGQSNVNKSYFAIQIAISLACGQTFIGFDASKPSKVLYLDGEVGEKEFNKRVAQLAHHKIGKDIFSEFINSNLKFLTLESATHFLESQDEFLQNLEKEKISVVIIDNILSLVPDAIHNGKKLFNRLNKLKVNGISTIIIHHTGKDDDLLGSSDFRSLSQNILRLSKEDNITVHLEKTKVAPRLENKSIKLSLPIGGQWKQLTDWDGNKIEIPITNFGKENNCSNLPTEPEHTYLNTLDWVEDEYKKQRMVKIMLALNALGGSRQTHEIRGKIFDIYPDAKKLGEDSVRSSLKELAKHELVLIKGNGSSTTYELICYSRI